MRLVQIRNFVIISHVDHGKSTLADRLLEMTQTVPKEKMKPQYLDMMDLERERGVTIKMAPVRMIWKPNRPQIQNSNSETLNNTKILSIKSQKNSILEIRNSDLGFDGSEFILNLIDTPGHVDFSYEVSRALKAVEGALLLVDATSGVEAQTLANLTLAKQAGLQIIPLVNKIDLPIAEIGRTVSELESLGFKEDKIIQISAKTGQNIDKVLEAIVQRIPSPSGKIDTPLKGLIFDSVYDVYKGVIAYVRIYEGSVKAGDKVRFLATDLSSEIQEVGYFMPQLTPCDEISAGEIGYIKTGLRDIRKVKIGDTVTSFETPSTPLPGFQKPKPMIYGSIYPLSSNNFGKLKNALYRLQLNDSSLTIAPESSKALGAGFRCGFLGMFHLEITKERIQRDCGFEIIISRPTADIKMLDGVYYEPYVRLEIVTPNIYLGQVMDLARQRRAEYKEMRYLGERAILIYEAPLSEVIIDFYDQLKNISSGFASMNYQVIGYRKADLVQLDILAAGEKIEPLSQIVPREKAETIGRDLVKRLKELIPRHLFEVSLQAAIENRIIAREDIPALKKNVTAHLYGGDITRKRKLWEKQAAGKKRMKQIGRVYLPADIFLKLLKR
jgi:GTP-binding protein LepA